MWILWLIPVASFGLAVRVFYGKSIKEAQPPNHAAPTAQVVQFARPQAGLAPMTPVSRLQAGSPSESQSADPDDPKEITTAVRPAANARRARRGVDKADLRRAPSAESDASRLGREASGPALPARPMGERERRSARIVCAVPLKVSNPESVLQAESAVINAHGALILSPEPIPEGTPLMLVNQKNGARVEAFVVFTGLTPLSVPSPSGETALPRPHYKLGVEFYRPMPEFWGSDYTLTALAPPSRGAVPGGSQPAPLLFRPPAIRSTAIPETSRPSRSRVRAIQT